MAAMTDNSKTLLKAVMAASMPVDSMAFSPIDGAFTVTAGKFHESARKLLKEVME